MIHINDWDAIPDATEFERPVPGGYIGYICDYTDVDQLDQNGKGQYLKLFWDFTDGNLRGSINEAYQRLGYWFGYGTFIKSYKNEKALKMFKAFKTALEVSNRGYRFDDQRLDDMKGKYIGIVLGEEEYRKQDGTINTRLYVAQVRSVHAIQEGDFKVPPMKKLDVEQRTPPQANQWGAPVPAAGYGQTAQQPQQAAFGGGYAKPQQQSFGGYSGGFAPLPDDGDVPF